MPSSAVISVAFAALASTLPAALAGSPSWTALCTGVAQGIGNTPGVFALQVYNDGASEALYAGGRFGFAGGVAANNIAKWNGSSWAPLGGGLGPSNLAVRDLAVFDDGNGPALYACGDFNSPSGVALNKIAKWDGAQWLPLSGPNGAGMTGLNAEVYALEVFDDGNGPALYAGGNFDAAGGVPAFDLAKWDGIAWSPVGGGTNGGGVRALHAFDDGRGPALFVGGVFTQAGGLAFNRIARWDGLAWSSVGGGVSGGGSPTGVEALAVYDDGAGPALYVGGNFGSASGAGTVNDIARWNGQAWASLSGPQGVGVNSNVYSLAATEDGLLVGGRFERAGGIDVGGFALWNGAQWAPAGGRGVLGGTVPTVYAIATINAPQDTAVYIGGFFLSVDGIAASRIARLGHPRVNESCPGDFNFDCLTNFSDLNTVLANFGVVGTHGTVLGDANGDGVVNFADLNAVLSGFGQPCDSVGAENAGVTHAP